MSSLIMGRPHFFPRSLFPVWAISYNADFNTLALPPEWSPSIAVISPVGVNIDGGPWGAPLPLTPERILAWQSYSNSLSAAQRDAYRDCLETMTLAEPLFQIFSILAGEL
jgi:hypothetical protein